MSWTTVTVGPREKNFRTPAGFWESTCLRIKLSLHSIYPHSTTGIVHGFSLICSTRLATIRFFQIPQSCQCYVQKRLDQVVIFSVQLQCWNSGVCQKIWLMLRAQHITRWLGPYKASEYSVFDYPSHWTNLQNISWNRPTVFEMRIILRSSPLGKGFRNQGVLGIITTHWHWQRAMM